jgi:hypothetical protein
MPGPDVGKVVGSISEDIPDIGALSTVGNYASATIAVQSAEHAMRLS